MYNQMRAMGNNEQALTVLHLTAGSVLGGVTRHICDLSVEMKRRGHRVMAGGSRGPWQDLLGQAGITWIDLPLDGGPWALWGSARLIAQIVVNEGVNIVHCHFRRPVLAARLAGCGGMGKASIVYTLHLAPIPIGGIWRWVSDFGDLVIAPSEQGRQWITQEAGVPRARVALVPHGVPLDKWTQGDEPTRQAARRELGLEQFDAVAAFIGRFEYPKNEQWALDVAAECRRRNMNVGLIVCGDGPNAPAVRQRIARDGLGDVVRLAGYVDPIQAYRAADLVLLPSSIEGFGYVAAEAAACGVAVLRTRTAGWQETVRDGITGRVVEIDRDALVWAAVAMLSDVAGLRRMGEAAAAFARTSLSFAAQVDLTIEAYRSLLGRSGGNG